MEKFNVGIIGLGCRGSWAVNDILTEREDVNVTFVCDEYEDRTEESKAVVEKKQGHTPHTSLDWHDVVNSPDVDVVVNCTAWEGHVPISTAAMEAGKPVAMEVGGAYQLDECYRLVDTYKKTGIHCMMLENCCFNREELMVLNMVQQGLFGKIVACSGGYQHDLREEITFGRENRHYRLRNYKARNTDNYPTHELGPIAKVLDLGHGNRMKYLVSMATGSWGLNDYARRNEKADPELRDYKFHQGDIVKTLIMCEGGETVTLTLDTTLPRSYSRGFTVRGTRGAYFEDGDGVFLDGVNNEWDKSFYNNKQQFFEKYDHPLWRKGGALDFHGGHGGMDWLVYDEFFRYVRTGNAPWIDTYDTASWMSITPLAAKSIENGSAPVEIPDMKER